MVLAVDNVSRLDMAKNPVAHGMSNNIKTIFHYLREQVNKKKTYSLKKKKTDILTKPFNSDQFILLIKKLGVVSSLNIN